MTEDVRSSDNLLLWFWLKEDQDVFKKLLLYKYTTEQWICKYSSVDILLYFIQLLSKTTLKCIHLYLST